MTRHTPAATPLAAILATALAALVGFGAVPAAAQSGGQSGSQSGGQVKGTPAITAEEIGEEKLAAFVTAAQRVQDIVAEFRPEFEAASTEEEQARVSEAINDGIVAALDATPGISTQEYVQIARAARQDEALMGRIQERMQGS